MVKSLAVLPENLGSIPSTHKTHVALVPGNPTPSHRHACRQNTYARKIEIDYLKHTLKKNQEAIENMQLAMEFY